MTVAGCGCGVGFLWIVWWVVGFGCGGGGSFWWGGGWLWGWMVQFLWVVGFVCGDGGSGFCGWWWLAMEVDGWVFVACVGLLTERKRESEK